MNAPPVRRHKGHVLLSAPYLVLIALTVVPLSIAAALDWGIVTLVPALRRTASWLSAGPPEVAPWAMAPALPTEPLAANFQPDLPGGTCLMGTITTNRNLELLDQDCAGIAELISRSDNGVDVALLWKRDDNTAIVVVVDHVAGESFLLHVHERDNPLDMFHHPYAYAASRDIDHCPEHGEEFRKAA